MKNSDEILNEKRIRIANIEKNLNKVFCDYGKAVFFYPEDMEKIFIYTEAIKNMLSVLSELKEEIEE